MKPDKLNRQYYPVLDGIRGLAILLVICYHNFGFFNYFFFGWLGVDLFFVLSGFLITDILIRTFGQENYLRNFYVRRSLRIFPLYYLTLIFFLIILPLMKSNALQLDYYIDNQAWLWTYLQNWLYTFREAGTTTTLHHLWSLAVEEQFYLFWPLAFILFRKPSRLFILVATLLVAVIITRYVVWVNRIEDLAYFNLYTFTRIDGICIGCMLSLLWHMNPSFLRRYTTVIVLALAALNFLFYFFNSQYRFTFPYLAIVGYTTFAVIFALLIFEAIEGENKVVNFLFNIGILKFFGRISYALYIFHWPLFLALGPFIAKWSGDHLKGVSSEFIAAIISTLLAIGLSFISTRYFESYFLRLKKRFE